MATGAILLAAGAGRRFGGRRPKQLLPLRGEPLFMRPLRAFLSVPTVREVVVVTSRNLQAVVAARIRRGRFGKRVRVVEGGAFRGASVRNGFLALSARLDVVLVHDAARPLVDASVIRRVEGAARRFGAALAAWPLPDSLKRVGRAGHVRATVPRGGLWLAQTPQGFRRHVAERVLTVPRKDATDDVSLAERKGIRVKVVPGAPWNIKVTVPADLAVCRALCA